MKKAVEEASKYITKAMELLSIDDEKLQKKVIRSMLQALSYRRLFAYGGILKNIRAELKLQDEEKSNLINLGDDEIDTTGMEYFVEVYKWCQDNGGQYQKFMELSEGEYKKLEKSMQDERNILRKMRIDFKPGNMLYPVPVVMVSCADSEGRSDIVTVAWTGTICTNPPMVYISLRPSRYSYDIIKKSGEFVINLTNERLAKIADECGVKSGRDVDKWKLLKIEQLPSKVVAASSIKESPVCIECKVENILELGSHHMFTAKVVAVNVDAKYMDEKNKFDLTKADMVVYNHGEYIGLSKVLGTFGYSVKKKKRK